MYDHGLHTRPKLGVNELVDIGVLVKAGGGAIDAAPDVPSLEVVVSDVKDHNPGSSLTACRDGVYLGTRCGTIMIIQQLWLSRPGSPRTSGAGS
ncbi:hypothetical protein F751_6435 [Auxenochlorella protothecoides]|uniref:Uncharacterized protein n=1 Tax=Auxenochlorella protothecoides TaxID=3075 RepID=A0A087SB22_AUXPR|nr:hypothetical protein F751_6435 [Auxenochlorella protothecoides]KFM22926.1 hypothetical protein F751_6435 [Auxenochlorella protothecoides]